MWGASAGAAAPADGAGAGPDGGLSEAQAARFLEHATFGVTTDDLERVRQEGIDAFIGEQLKVPPTLYTGYHYVPAVAPADCRYDPAAPTGAASLCARDSYSPFLMQRDFFTHALYAPDQLRQRVAFALSQIFVVSSVEIYEAYGLADYQNVLLADAFGNFRTLLEDVTLSPVMGHYLDMVDNSKPNEQLGTTPNENYAREVLQLFSIGLYQLNPDGTPKLDTSGAPIPTYDQSVIEGFASVFTGWAYPPLSGAVAKWDDKVNFDGKMVAFEGHHATNAKLLLDGRTLPAGHTVRRDLADALDDIFQHPNVGPFIGMQLIQHLVTSNPSPAYVARVAAVFADNGQGVRGDLAAVVRAILTDREAREDRRDAQDFGHFREPALFITSTLRSLGGRSDGIFLSKASAQMGEPIFSPETVFNFYPPSYEIPGTAILAPEMGIADATTALARANFINTLIMLGGAKPNPTVPGSIGTSVDLTPFAIVTDPAALVRKLNQVLLHGRLSEAGSDIVQLAVNAVTSTDPLAPARVASYLMLTSAQFQVER